MLLLGEGHYLRSACPVKRSTQVSKKERTASLSGHCPGLSGSHSGYRCETCCRCARCCCWSKEAGSNGTAATAAAAAIVDSLWTAEGGGLLLLLRWRL